MRRLRRQDKLRLLLTVGEGITLVLGRTGADGMVRDDVTASVDTAATRTGVPTLLVEAGLVLRALRAHHAFWSAVRWRALASTSYFSQ